MTAALYCALMLLVAAVCHELGHLFCSIVLGVEVKKFRFVYMVRDHGTDLQNLAIAISGPLVNLLAASCYILWPWLGIDALLFSLANLLVGILNLIPLPLTDGRRIMALLSTHNPNPDFKGD